MEQNTSKGDEKVETNSSNEEKKSYEKDKLKVEETLIDCTSTIPVMKTLLRKETESNNNPQCTRNINPLPRNNNAHFLKLQSGHTQERLTSQSKIKSSDIISDLFSNRWQNSSCRVSIRTFPKDRIANGNVLYPAYNKTNEGTESIRQPNGLCNALINNDVSTRTSGNNVAPVNTRNGVIQNNNKFQNDFILAKASRYNVIPSSAPRNDTNLSIKKFSNTSKNNTISSNILKAEVSTNTSKNYAISATTKVIVHTSQNTKVLSSSAVQTELTCIPVKGTKPRYKWNSVETLLDTHYKPYVGGTSQEKTQNIFSQKLKENTGANNSHTESHPPDKNCNRQNCFYI